MQKIKGLLFDFDGVILDTYTSYRQLVVDVLNEYGYSITLQDAIERWKGYNAEQIAKELMFEGFQLANDFLTEVTMRSKTYKAHESMIIDGVMDLLNSIDLPKSICSNGRSVRIKSNLEDAKISDYFDSVVGRDTAGEMKPKPGVYLKGAENLGLDITECLAIEDSEVGLQAAVESGAITVGFTGTGGKRNKLAKLKPNYIVDDLREVIEIIKNHS